jgi:hypothetical protein
LGAESAQRPDDYPNRRSESWFEFAEIIDQLDVDSNEELGADLLAPRYSLDSSGRRVVERKSETKKRLRRSPDRADAAVMAFSVYPIGRRHGRPARVVTAADVRLPSLHETAARDALRRDLGLTALDAPPGATPGIAGPRLCAGCSQP